MRKYNRVLKVGRRGLLVLAVLSLLAFSIAPQLALAQHAAAATATSSGFGAAFGYAASIGNTAFTNAGSIGNGAAAALALAPGGISAGSTVFSFGSASVMAASIANPFGAMAQVLTTSTCCGYATGSAFAISPLVIHPCTSCAPPPPCGCSGCGCGAPVHPVYPSWP